VRGHAGLGLKRRIYANVAIEAALTIRMVFHLPLRQTEGFLRSLADMLEVELPNSQHRGSQKQKPHNEIRCRACSY
jgi:hypothetical protein